MDLGESRGKMSSQKFNLKQKFFFIFFLKMCLFPLPQGTLATIIKVSVNANQPDTQVDSTDLEVL